MTACTRRPDSLWTKCRCTRCRARNVRVAKFAKSGVFERPDHAAVVARVTGWRAAGFTDEWIASACGVNRWQIHRIAARDRNGLPSKVFRGTARLILAGDIRTGTSGLGPALGIRRRVQALVAIGYTQDNIAAATGIAQGLLSRIANGQAVHVVARNWHTIVDHYERVCMTPGPSKVAAANARRNGWAPPLAWDEEAIDDPTATPHVDPSKRPGGEKFTVGDLEDCASWGLDRRMTADRLKVDVSAIEHRCRREGRRDLLARLDRNALAREAS